MTRKEKQGCVSEKHSLFFIPKSSLPKQLQNQHRHHPRRPQDGTNQQGKEVPGEGDPCEQAGEVYRSQGSKAHSRRDNSGADGLAHPDEERQSQKARHQQPGENGIGSYPISTASSPWSSERPADPSPGRERAGRASFSSSSSAPSSSRSWRMRKL